MKATVLSTFALLMLVAVTHGQNLDQLLWQNSALDIDGILENGTFQEVEASSELSCVLMAAHKFKKNGVCFQKPRCVIPSGTEEKATNASTEWTCKGTEDLEETTSCDVPFIQLDDVGCLWVESDAGKTYEGAVADCKEKGASVAVVEDLAAFEKLRDHLRSTASGDIYYVDIRLAADSVWRWSGTGTQVDERFFHYPGPFSDTESCAFMYFKIGFYLTVGECEFSCNYICLK